MKTLFAARTLKLVAPAFVALLLGYSARAQTFSIDWFTVDGGGGTSTGGVYSITGTIGQPDAGGTMTNGQFSLTGGFWALPQAVQVAGSPTLTIVPAAAGFAVLSWTPSTAGFVLQQSAALAPTPVGWSNAPVGYTNGATIPLSPSARFFRLIKP